MTDQLLSDVLDFFLREAEWPLVRVLQASYGPRTSVRALAALAGSRLIVCQEGPDGRCFLTLEGLAERPAAGKCLEHFAQAVGFVGRRYEEQGVTAVTRADFGNALGVEGAELTRLGALLYQVGRIWSGASWAKDCSSFSVTPSEESAFFRDVNSFREFQEAWNQLARNDRIMREAMSAESGRIRGDTMVSGRSDGPSRYRLKDRALDALLQNDLVELANVHSQGAWKSVAILAGSCLEAVLLDVCQQRESECESKWGPNWKGRIGASEMARFAASRTWISEDHGDMANVLRRWRNIIHPRASLKASAPTKELADTLCSILRLLLAELRPDMRSCDEV